MCPINLSPLFFFVPRCLLSMSLSIVGLNADGTRCVLDTSVAEDGMLADTSLSFPPTH